MAKKRSKKKKATPVRRRLFWRALVAVTACLLLALIALDVMVQRKFAGAKWQLPSHVYSRPLEIYTGMALEKEQLVWELLGLGYRRVNSAALPGQFSVSSDKVEIFTRGFAFWDSPEPSRRLLIRFSRSGVAGLHTASGDRLQLLRLEPRVIGGIYPDHQEGRELVKFSGVPETLRDGLVAVEDHNFYNHWGLSFRGIARALLANLRQAQVVQGGSTLTQQLVKNFYLDERRTLSRKALEAVMAIMLEWHFDKEAILEGYLNEVYLGQAGNRGVHGFGLASRHYFGLPITELGLHQQALLVGMVKGATYYNPMRHPERVRRRRNLVLDVMVAHGVISARDGNRAKARPLDISVGQRVGREQYPGYMELVKRQLKKDYRERDLRTEGLKIFTNFDPLLQRQLEKSVADNLASIERDFRLPGGGLQAGATVVRVGTGEVLALLGDRKAGFPGFNRALDARRPAGSIIKTAVYLAALEKSGQFTLASQLADSDVEIVTPDGNLWRPRNFERRSHGQVPLFEAFGHSYNQATARLGMDLGLPQVIDVMHRLGYEKPVKEVPSLLLGAVEMSVMDVAAMYHTVAAGGYRSPLRAIDAVYTARGELLQRYPYQVEQQFSPEVMHLLQYALQVVVREGTGKTVYRQLPDSLVLAGKTGTSNGQRDSWFAGFSGDYLNVVWLGRDDNGTTPVTGGTGALKVWSDFMAAAPQSSFLYTKPEGVVYHWVETSSGIRTGSGCPGARKLPFILGSEPERHSRCYRRSLRNFTDWLRGALGI